MKVLIAISLFITLTSCLTVSFNQPQPKDGNRLQEFPEELRGTWTKDDGDFFTINAAGIQSSNLIYDSLENLIDTSYKYTALSDSLQLHQGGKYYVYNMQDSEDMWNFAVVNVDVKGNIYTYLCDDAKFYSELKGIKVDSLSYSGQHYLEGTDEFLDFDTTIHNPSAKEISKMDYADLRNVYFNGQIRIRDLRKIAVRKNLISIYRSDGTVEEANRESETDEPEVEEVNE